MDSNLTKKQNEITSLKKRRELLESHQKRVKNHNLQVNSKINSLEDQVVKLRQINVELSQLLEEEFLKERHFQERIETVQVEASELEKSYLLQRERLNKKSKEVLSLEKELEKLTAKKRAFENYIKLTRSSELALETRSNSIRSKLGSLNSTLISNSIGSKSKGKGLSESIVRLAGKSEKEASFLYTCANEVIQKIEENEFEGLKYKFKVNKNNKHFGLRLFFSNVTTQYGDLVKELGPTVKELGTRFRSHGLKIQTKANRSPNGVVKEIDITIVVKLGVERNKSFDPQHSINLTEA